MGLEDLISYKALITSGLKTRKSIKSDHEYPIFLTGWTDCLINYITLLDP